MKLWIVVFLLGLYGPAAAQFTPRNVCYQANLMDDKQLQRVGDSALKHGICLSIRESNRALFSGDSKYRDECQRATHILLKEYTEGDPSSFRRRSLRTCADYDL